MPDGQTGATTLPVQMINDAILVTSLTSDFYLIGWQGARNSQAPLVAMSSAVLRDYIGSLVSGRSSDGGETTVSTMAMASPMSHAVNVEQMFDSFAGSTKEIAVVLGIVCGDADCDAVVKSNVNVDASVGDVTLVAAGRGKVADIPVALGGVMPIDGTVQATFVAKSVASAAKGYARVVITEDGLLHVVVPFIAGETFDVNVSYRSELVAGTHVLM